MPKSIKNDPMFKDLQKKYPEFVEYQHRKSTFEPVIKALREFVENQPAEKMSTLELEFFLAVDRVRLEWINKMNTAAETNPYWDARKIPRPGLEQHEN
jgi:hypothetical protein